MLLVDPTSVIASGKSEDKNSIYKLLDLDPPRGAEWMIRGAYTSSFRFETAPETANQF